MKWCRVNLNQHLESASTKFAEHFHDCWAMKEVSELGLNVKTLNFVSLAWIDDRSCFFFVGKVIKHTITFQCKGYWAENLRTSVEILHSSEVSMTFCKKSCLLSTGLLSFSFQIEEGWLFGSNYDDDRKTHPLLKPYHLLDEKVSSKCHYTLVFHFSTFYSLIFDRID